MYVERSGHFNLEEYGARGEFRLFWRESKGFDLLVANKNLGL